MAFVGQEHQDSAIIAVAEWRQDREIVVSSRRLDRMADVAGTQSIPYDLLVRIDQEASLALNSAFDSFGSSKAGSMSDVDVISESPTGRIALHVPSRRRHPVRTLHGVCLVPLRSRNLTLTIVTRGIADA